MKLYRKEGFNGALLVQDWTESPNIMNFIVLDRSSYNKRCSLCFHPTTAISIVSIILMIIEQIFHDIIESSVVIYISLDA